MSGHLTAAHVRLTIDTSAAVAALAKLNVAILHCDLCLRRARMLRQRMVWLACVRDDPSTLQAAQIVVIERHEAARLRQQRRGDDPAFAIS